MNFDALDKHSPMNSKKYAPVLSVLIKEFENGFQECQKKSSICVCDTIFSQHKYMTCKFSNGMYRVAIRYSTQKSDHVSLPDFYKPSLTREKYPSLHNHTLFMSSLFGAADVCEQPFPRMKGRKSKISSEISDEHLDTSLRIASTAVEPGRAISCTNTSTGSDIPRVSRCCCSLSFFVVRKNTEVSLMY